MKVILFGATGMVGQGVLRECLRAPDVERVLAVGRSATRQTHPKLGELLHGDFTDFSAVAEQLRGYDACFFCVGTSAAGMTEAEYHRMTYDTTLAAAETLVGLSPEMTFIYVSGSGTDSTERGRTMWARVKGQTENALLRLPFRRSIMMRPAYIQPQHGIRSKTRLYRVLYAVTGPLFPLWRWIAPKHVITLDEMSRAMLTVARHGAPRPILENHEIRALADASPLPTE